MSLTIVLTCPHCESKKMTFDVADSSFVRKGFTKFLCQCRHCEEVVVVTGTEGHWDGVDFGGVRNREISIHSVFPQPSEPVPPPDTPDDVAKPFINGLTALSVGLIDSAANSFRTTLEKATSHLLERLGTGHQDHAKKSLYDRIEFLRDNHLITPSLCDWAHIIRDLGNMGTHGDPEFSESQATELKNFTEQFLYYVFTMPAQVESIRGNSVES